MSGWEEMRELIGGVLAMFVVVLGLLIVLMTVKVIRSLMFNIRLRIWSRKLQQ